MMSEPQESPEVPESVPEPPRPNPDPRPAPFPEPNPDPEPATPTEPNPPPPIDPAASRTVGGAHDLSDHPAVLQGQVLHTGDTVLSRDPNAPNFRRPVLADANLKVDISATGEVTNPPLDNPARKSAKGRSKGDGAGPES